VTHIDATTVAGRFDACVTKNSGVGQGFDITLNSPPVQ